MINSLYIHIPFCKKKCLYCDFNSFDNKSNLINEYMNALKKEIIAYNLKSLDTVYIGGGTPSFIDSRNIVEVLSIIPTAKEVTVEMNPCTVTMDKLKDYKNAGVNRISIGLQTTKDDILKEIGRAHSFDEFKKAYEMIRGVGFDNVNVDLMFGLPSQSLQDLKESVDYLVSINPEHISCYSLILHNDIFKHLPSDDDERKMYYYIKEKLKASGYELYEISNFAKSGFESKHNLAYWNQKEYAGVGAGASSYINGTRYTNELNLEKYIELVDENFSQRYIEEVQNIEDTLREYVILRLRLIEGVNINDINLKFGIDFENKFKNEIDTLKKNNLISIIDSNLKLTDKGLDFANVVWREFLE